MARKRKKMTEEEKKAKWGDKYDPNYKPKPKGNRDKPNGNPQGSSVSSTNLHPNPWELYAVDEQIARDTGSFSYSNITGISVDVEATTSVAANNNSIKSFQWKGQNVMALHVINAQPSTDDEDGVATAATQLYTWLRHVNSGARNYEQADSFMYVLAMVDVYSEFLECRRALMLTNYFSVRNRNVPKRIIKALGFDYDDLIENVAKYRGKLNRYAKRINALALPKYFKAIQRKDAIFSNIYSDSSAVTGQFYVYVRDGYYMFSGEAEETGTSLQFTPFNTAGAVAPLTMAQRLSILNNMILALERDTDANTISGDILHAFEQSELYLLSTISEDAVIVPVMDEDAMAQIENSYAFTSYGVTRAATLSSATLNVTQRNGVIYWKPEIGLATVTSNAIVPRAFLFNSHKDDPNYKDNLEWSRMITIAKTNAPTSSEGGFANGSVALVSCGLELLVSYELYAGGTGAVGFELAQTKLVDVNSSGVVTPTFNSSNVVADRIIGQYDWHPAQYLYMQTTDLNKEVSYTLITNSDIKRYVWLASSTVKTVHDCANLAAYYSDKYSA